MRVLIVEDEHKIANSIKKGLEQEGIAADAVYDGNSGFDMAVGEKYDVMILDILLPDINGLELTKKLREQNIQTPILLLTALGQLENKVKGLNSGADDYLVKPFAFAELLARVKALGRRSSEDRGTVLTCQDLVLNTVSYQVTRDGREINLSRKEFALLEYLMRHMNMIVNKDQIISNLWNYDADVLPNTVEVYMGYLRNKIDRKFPGKTALLKTFRGFGYKISDKQ
jgi:DNA-binding response OmpR family regulator